MSEQLTWRVLDEAGEATTAANRPAFLPQTLASWAQTFFWPYNLPQERYNFMKPVPKKEIPDDTPAVGTYLYGAQLWDTTHSGTSGIGYEPSRIQVTITAAPVKTTPTVTMSPSPTTIISTQPLTETVTVNPTSGNPTPTGTVTLSGGTFNSGPINLINGSVPITIPGGSLPANSSAQLTANYSGDNRYNSTTGYGLVSVNGPSKTTPTVTMSPSPTTIISTQPLTETVTVSPTSGNPTPTGTVTLSGGTFNSGAFNLVNGNVPITIPGGSLPPNSSAQLTANYSGDSNYNSATGYGLVSVNGPSKTTPTITWNTPAAITYGTALSGTQLNPTASVSGTFSYSPPQGTVLNAGSQTLTANFTPTDTTDYNTASKSVTLTVNKATPTITWNTPGPVTVGTALSSTQLNPTASVAGSFSYNPTSGTVMSTAGNITLTVTFVPNDTTDYNSNSATVVLTVTTPGKTTPTITWSAPAAITYGTALSGTQLNPTASVAGSFSYSPPQGTVLNAGSQTLTANFTPTDTTDYNTASKSVTLTVNKATPTITWNTPAPVTVGTTLSSTQLNPTASVAGNFSYNPTSGTVMSTAGNVTLSTTFTPNDTTDYNSNSATVQLTVTAPGKTTPIVMVTPNSSSITVTQALIETVSVNGSPTPTGSVTLIGGGYNSTQPLGGGSAQFNIAAGALAVGNDTLTATYTPDASSSSTYNGATGTSSVTVTSSQVSCNSYSATSQITGVAHLFQLGLGNGKLVASGNGQASVVDLASNQVSPVPFSLAYSGGYGAKVSVLNSQAFVPIYNLLQGEVAVLDLGSATISGYFQVGTEPFASLVVGNQLYIGDASQFSNGDPSQVFVVNPVSGQISASINVGHLIQALVSDPAHNRLYALNYNDSTASAIDLTSNAVTSTISLGVMPRAGIVVNGTLFVVGDLPTTQNGQIVEVNTTSNTLGTTVSVGRDPMGIVAVNGCAFIPNSADYTVSVFDLTANGIVKTISSGIGNDPTGAVADPSSGSVYIANQGSNSISILTSSSTTTPTVTVVPTPPSITTAQQLSVAMTVNATSGNPTPTGSVVLVAGTGSFNGTLVSGVATITVPAGTFAAGTDQLTATYTPDSTSSSVYNGATGTGSVIVTAPGKTTPTVTVTPSASSITTAQALTVTVVVSGGTGNPTPSGTVTLSSGGYSAQQTLASGAASFTIAAGTLGNGANTLTASYSGDATYAVASSTTAVTVEPVSVTTTTPSPVNPGSSTTSTVTLTGSNGYSGTMNLTCTPTSSPAGAQSLPTCTLNPASVTLASGGNGTSTLTVNTTAASTTALARPTDQHLWKLGSGGVALAALLLFGIPFRRRRWTSMLALLLLVAAAGAIGCVSGKSTSSGGGSSTPATTAGNYTFTVAATDSANAKITASTTISVTVQ